MMNPIVNIQPFHFKQLVKGHYSLDEIYLLQLVASDHSLGNFKEARVNALVKKMKRDGHLDDSGYITQAGIDLLFSLEKEGEELQLNKIEKTEDAFERWWKAFPANNGFEHKGKSFPVTRSMRIKKDECKVKFHKILSEGQYTVEQLIGAIEAEVFARKEESVVKKANQLTYMRSTLPYLNGNLYEGFIDQPVKTETPKQTQKFL